MIVFGAIVPHSPLLITSIGKDHREKLSATLAAYAEIEQALYLTQPDCICIIAPHGARYPDAFSANLATKYVANLKSFGDFTTAIEARSDPLLLDRIQRKLRQESVPFTLTSNEELDYGYAIPLLLLTSKLNQRKIVPLSPSNGDGAAHRDFGRQLKRVLHAETARVAVIASVDFSHKLNAQSPSGASMEGPEFDRRMQEGLTAHDLNALLAIEPAIIAGAAQCAHSSVMTLLGTLEEMNVTHNVLSYEAPFGVGYLTARYDVA